MIVVAVGLAFPALCLAAIHWLIGDALKHIPIRPEDSE